MTFMGLNIINKTKPNIRIDRPIKSQGKHNHETTTMHTMKSQGIQNEAR
jgi:hypothetical protein